MLGRKRECLNPKQRQTSKRRWQAELDQDTSDEDEVTAEELEQWRRRDAEESAKQSSDLSCAVHARNDDLESAPKTARQEKTYAWMDSDEEDDVDAATGARCTQMEVPDLLEEVGVSTDELPEPTSRALGVGIPPPVPTLAMPGALASSCLPGLPPPPPPPASASASSGPLLHQAQVGGFAPFAVVQSRTEEWFSGRIKRYTDMPGGGGYGFIDCEETKIRFARDVYVHKNQMQGFGIGDEVSFTIVRNSKGEPQARNVMRPEDALLLRPQITTETAAPSAASSLMDEAQARQFQARLRSFAVD